MLKTRRNYGRKKQASKETAPADKDSEDCDKENAHCAVKQVKAGKKDNADHEDSFDLNFGDKKPEDEFDLLLSSPLKQEVNFKPLGFWSQKVKSLENKENVKKKKCELYELSDSDGASTSFDGKKPKKKGKSNGGRERKTRKKAPGAPGFKYDFKILPRKKDKDKNERDYSLVRERILLSRLKDKVSEKEDKLTFDPVSSLGLTSTPGPSEKLNLVGGSNFDFLSPILAPQSLSAIAEEERPPEGIEREETPAREIKVDEKQHVEVIEAETPKRKGSKEKITKRTAGRVSENEESASRTLSDLSRERRPSESEVRIEAEDCSTLEEGVEGAEESGDSTLILGRPSAELTLVAESDPPLGPTSLSPGGASFADLFKNVTVRRNYNLFLNFRPSEKGEGCESPRVDESDLSRSNAIIFSDNDENSCMLESELSTTIESVIDETLVMPKRFSKIRRRYNPGPPSAVSPSQTRANNNENETSAIQQKHGTAKSDSKLRSRRYCRLWKNINGILFPLEPGHDDSSLVVESRESSVLEDVECSVCRGHVKTQEEPEPQRQEKTISGDLTFADDFELPAPIFESTVCRSPKQDVSLVEDATCVSIPTQEYSVRLKPGKAWTRSALVLKRLHNATLHQDETMVGTGKGRRYWSFVEEVLRMQQPGADEGMLTQNHEAELSALQNEFSRMNLSRNFGSRTVLVLDTSSDPADRSFRSVFSAESNTTACELGLVDGMPFKAVSARDVVLMRCNQEEPLPFEEYFNETTLKNCRKIGEGVFGEVFTCNSNRVIKIIPVEGSQLVNGEPQKKFEEVLSEMIIAAELSNLSNGESCQTSGFSQLHRCWCVCGEYPSHLLDLWNDFDAAGEGSENDSPAMFKSDQLYLILEFENGGKDLESFVFASADQALSIFIQATCSLAAAEKALEFEHRDMHWGNILISPTRKKYFTCLIDGEEYTVLARGVKVTIIDFTLSRMTYDSHCMFNDLAVDPTLFTSQGDYQFDIYRMMKEEVADDWSAFRPKTNLMWLHYVADKMITMVRYKKTNVKCHKDGISALEKLKSSILRYNNSAELLLGEGLV